MKKWISKGRTRGLFVEDHDRYCTNMDEHIHKVFKDHQLDPMKKMSKAEIKSLSQDLLKIDRPSFLGTLFERT